ncbi:DUF3139 domain-containing protein [Alkalibacterium sp. 20]|uniref:DUF3139 domain-containing protein n=1 Tax=Alkalibacterium sp. 20 TaxID=1798803 RepID=UPI0008FFF7FE|nr:DUF3139 domain-containing protein [Alkalibacterium sp. 20]OJF90270.1 hypothetical protein AX762_11775 [Alkalibacterium sp. 20]
MSKYKKKFLGFLFLLIFGFCLYIVYLYRDITAINEAIAQEGWNQSIESERTSFDTKRGTFYKQITYQDSEGIDYYYYVNRNPKDDSEIVFSAAYDEENVGIDDPTIPYQFQYPE